MRIMFLNKLPARHGLFDDAKIEKLLNSYASPGTKVECHHPDDYEGSQVLSTLSDMSMLNGLDHMIETPSLIKKIVWAQENGYDAVIQSNTFDPGVEGGRLIVDIPVLGPFRTTLHTASILTDRIGIMVPLDTHISYVWRILRTHGMDHKVIDILPVGIYGSDIATRGKELLDASIKQIKALKDKGAEAVIPLGGALIPYVVDPAELQKEAGIPVYNTKACSIRFAETCIGLGLRHSPLTYPQAKLTAADFA